MDHRRWGARGAGRPCGASCALAGHHFTAAELYKAPPPDRRRAGLLWGPGDRGPGESEPEPDDVESGDGHGDDSAPPRLRRGGRAKSKAWTQHLFEGIDTTVVEGTKRLEWILVQPRYTLNWFMFAARHEQ